MAPSRAAVLTLAAVGAACALIGAGRPWLTVPVSTVTGSRPVGVAGTELAPMAGALAPVALAAGVVLLTAGRWGRRVAAVLLLLTGCGMVAATVGVLRDPTAAAVAVGHGPGPAHLVGWVWSVLTGGVLVVAGATGALKGLRHWPVPARRYERAAGGRPEQLSPWQQLDRGEDPTTADAPVDHQDGDQSTAVDRVPGGPGAGPAAAEGPGRPD